MTQIQELQDLVKNFIAKRDWQQFHTPKNIAMSIAIESAEVMEIFQWYTNEQCSDPEFIENNRENIEDELADVLIYTISMINKLDIDMVNIIKRKMARNEFRFPIEKVKGKLA